MRQEKIFSWLATEKAVKDLKFKSAPSVNHSKGYRLVDSGWHSNDIESEFSRLKGRLRPGIDRIFFIDRHVAVPIRVRGDAVSGARTLCLVRHV